MNGLLKKGVFAAILILASGASFAQASADPTASMWTNLASIADNFFNNFNIFQNADSLILGAGLGISQKLMSTALTLGGSLALINLLWVAIDHLVLRGHRDLIWPPIIHSVVMAVITGAVLRAYPLLAQGAIDFFMGVTNLVSGSASTSQVQSIGNQLTNLAINGIKSALESVHAFDWNAKAILLIIIDVFLTLIVGLFCMIMAILMFVSVVSSIFTGTLMAGLAIALGPLFIATIASGFTRTFFDKWFGFLCSALFVKVVVMTMLALLVGIFDSSTNAQNSVGQMNAGGFAFGKLLVLAVSLWIMKQLMESAPNIASALMPGGLGVSVKSAMGTAVAAASGVVGAGLAAATGGAGALMGNAGAMSAGKDAAGKLAAGAMSNAKEAMMGKLGATPRAGPASKPKPSTSDSGD